MFYLPLKFYWRKFIFSFCENIVKIEENLWKIKIFLELFIFLIENNYVSLQFEWRISLICNNENDFFSFEIFLFCQNEKWKEFVGPRLSRCLLFRGKCFSFVISSDRSHPIFPAPAQIKLNIFNHDDFIFILRFF